MWIQRTGIYLSGSAVALTAFSTFQVRCQHVYCCCDVVVTFYCTLKEIIIQLFSSTVGFLCQQPEQWETLPYFCQICMNRTWKQIELKWARRLAQKQTKMSLWEQLKVLENGTQKWSWTYLLPKMFSPYSTWLDAVLE